MSFEIPFRRAALAALLVAALAGCGRSPVTPLAGDGGLPPDAAAVDAELAALAPAPGGFDAPGGYPLHVGNRWVHQLSFRTSYRDAGDEPFALIFEMPGRVEREILCPITVFERPYVHERSSFATPEGITTVWMPMREDAQGLHEYDLIGSRRPPCDLPDVEMRARPAAVAPHAAVIAGLRARLVSRLAGPDGAAWAAALARHEAKLAATAALGGAAGAPGTLGETDPGELLRLAYPLGRGARWIIRGEPRFEAEVVGREVLRGERRYGGWRIRYTSDVYGSNDRVFAFYGSAGYLGLHAHIESEAMDDTGTPIGLITSEMRETIVSFTPAALRRDLAAR